MTSFKLPIEILIVLLKMVACLASLPFPKCIALVQVLM